MCLIPRFIGKRAGFEVRLRFFLTLNIIYVMFSFILKTAYRIRKQFLEKNRIVSVKVLDVLMTKLLLKTHHKAG